MRFLLRFIDKIKHSKSKSIFDNEDILDIFMHPFMPDGNIGNFDGNCISLGQIVSSSITSINMKQ